jgi:hypothetical protein
MRNALPNAGFIGFTGTPLVAGEEKTKELFGDYVSIYNYASSTADGATVPLYFEDRIPTLKLTNPRFDEDLTDIVEGADLDPDQSASSPGFSGSNTSSSRVRTVSNESGRTSSATSSDAAFPARPWWCPSTRQPPSVRT